MASITDKVTMGQGEYVVFHQLPTGEKRELSREAFEQVYKILNQYAPAMMIKSGGKCDRRYELMKAKMKELDPTLEAVFIPRTLYELIFIRKCIKEDLKNKRICSFLSPSLHNITVNRFGGDQLKFQDYLKEDARIQKEEKCWHLCYFKDADDSEHAGVKTVAYRLNHAIFKAFNPSPDGFSHQQLSSFAEKEMDFFKAHYQTGVEIMKRLNNGEHFEYLCSCSTPGPTTNFAFETTRGAIKPMGIRDEADAKIIRDIMALECSPLAKTSLFLPRGGDFQSDSITCKGDSDKPYSLSFGTSLFAGCIFDGGATAFHYMRQTPSAYVIPVPFDQILTSPFYIPTTHTVAQLFGDGEAFHGRTRAWKDFDVTEIRGINIGANSSKSDHLISALTKDEFIRQFQEYKAKAIQLK
ncbi:MAG: hypothetical protein ABSA17_04935 [Rhabdochlamydiaceae bacterium]|jgi:hypothetical protein